MNIVWTIIKLSDYSLIIVRYIISPIYVIDLEFVLNSGILPHFSKKNRQFILKKLL